MKIKSVTANLLKVPTEKFSSAIHSQSSIEVVTCTIKTDDGLEGLGFTYTVGTGGSAIKSLINDYLSRLIQGLNPEESVAIWEKMWKTTHGVGRGGVTSHAIAAVDIALWDLKGKQIGKPLYRLLGGTRNSIPLYATSGGWLHLSEEELVKSALDFAEKDYCGFKMKVGKKELREDVSRIMAVKDGTSGKKNFSIMVDVNQGWDLNEALRRGKAFQDLGVEWFEEPIIAENVSGYRTLAKELSVPIAVGENIFSRYEFERYITSEACDVLQPDVCRLGGITEWLQVASIAEANGIEISPHIVIELHVSLAASIPKVSCLEDLDWFARIFLDVPKKANGEIMPPDLPGIGLELDPKAMEKYCV